MAEEPPRRYEDGTMANPKRTRLDESGVPVRGRGDEAARHGTRNPDPTADRGRAEIWNKP